MWVCAGGGFVWFGGCLVLDVQCWMWVWDVGLFGLVDGLCRSLWIFFFFFEVALVDVR